MASKTWEDLEGERPQMEPRATGASFDAATGLLTIQLRGGALFAFPARVDRWLAKASDEELADVEVVSEGEGLRWPRLDHDAHVPGLILSIAGSEAWRKHLFAAEWGSLAGSAKTPAKAAAARENGKRGGRPRKSVSA